MKHNCIISRLDEPHIARIYLLDLDQNLVNNIRVLCTKSPETVRYFVPEELFLELRNGYPVPMKAVCRDGKGKRIIPIDPLKVLSEQLRDAPGAVPDPERIEIRVGFEGYPLPEPEEGTGFLKRIPRREPWFAADIPSGSRGSSNSSASPGSPVYDEQGPASGETAFRREPVRRSTVIMAVAAALLIFVAAGLWFMKDASARRFNEAMRASKYREAVMIYNGKILGHPSREAKADPQVEAAVSAIRTDYLSEILGYEDAREDLSVLTGIGKSGLSQLAKSALGEIEAYGMAAGLYMEGLESIRSGDYVSAIRIFSSLQGDGMPYAEGHEAASSFDTASEDEPSYDNAQEAEPESDTRQEIVLVLDGPYKDSEDQLALCIDRLIKSCVGIHTEEEYPEAAAKIEAALGYVPGNGQLTEAREQCRSRYEQLVIQSAVSAAEEKIAEDDYAGAFEVMAAAKDKLPESEKLEEKLAVYRRAFVAYITREACSSVDEGDISGAAELIEGSQRFLDCEEFTSLLSQVEEAGDRSEPEPREYIADRTEETGYSGAVRKRGQKDRFEIRADESGPHRFLLSKVTDGLAVRMTIYAPDGSEIYHSGVVGSGKSSSLDESGESGSGNSGSNSKGAGTKDAGTSDGGNIGSGNSDGSSDGTGSSGKSGDPAKETGATAGDSTTCRLEKDRVYTVEIEAAEGKGSYDLTVRHQKPAYDVTDYDVVSDRMEFADQQITCLFTAGLNGVYRFDLTDAEKVSGLRLDIYDTLGAKTAGAELEDGDGLTVRLEAGETYEIRTAKPERPGDYTLRLGKPSPPEDLTGRNIAAGSITYADQRNIYKYTAGAGSPFLFTIGNLPDDSSLRIDIYDSLGFKLGGEESIGNGGSVSAELEVGQDYEIQVTQRSGKGRYTLTVREDG